MRNKVKFTLNRDMDALPLSKSKAVDFNFTVRRGDKIACRIAVFKKDPSGVSSHLQQSWIFTTDRDIFKWFKDFGGSLIAKVKEFLFGNNDESKEIFGGKLNIDYSIAENETITFKNSFAVKGFDNNFNNASVVVTGE